MTDSRLRRKFLSIFPVGAIIASAPAPKSQKSSQIMMRSINPTDGNYSQGMEISGYERLVFVSGQVGEDELGHVPPTFHEQALLAWQNVATQLRAAGMTVNNIVKMTIYLSDRKYRSEAYETRHMVLGDHAPAMTIIICGIYSESWLLEIEAIAAA